MFFDLQVNGYGGVDFNSDQLDEIQLVTACEKLRNDGVEQILATIITNDLSQMCRQLRTIGQARQSDPIVKEVIYGFHLEGPFISRVSGFVGAHPKDHVLDANVDALKRLLDAGDGLVRMVTLAPECDPQQHLTRELIQQGVAVSAGHCDPNLAQLRASIDEGLSMFTHLGNACPLQLNRHDNIIQRVLSFASHLHIGFIADGIHLPLFALRNYLEIAGMQRAYVVTDAISAASCGPGLHPLGGQTVVVDQNLATWTSDGKNLVGSACTMAMMEKNLRRELNLSDDQVNNLLWNNPREAIGITA